MTESHSHAQSSIYPRKTVRTLTAPARMASPHTYPESAISRSDTVVDTEARSLLGRAIDDFLNELKEKDKKNPFIQELINKEYRSHAPASGVSYADQSAQEIHECLVKLEEQKRGRGYRLLHRLAPFLSSFKSLLKTCEVVLQASPLGVGAAFLGARVVLEIAITFHEYFELVVNAMDRIGDSLLVYQKYTEAFHERPDFQHCLIKSYKRIVEFWYNISRNLSRKRAVFKSITAPLVAEIKEAITSLKEDGAHISNLAQATQSVQSNRDRQSAKKKNIRDWILGSNAHVDVRTVLKEQLERRHNRTCSWFLSDERVVEWRDNAQDSLTLWYNASPGSGKTVLASAMIDHLLNRGAVVAWFFLSFNTVGRRDGMSCLRSIALQLLTIIETVPDSLVDIYEEEMKHHAINLESIDTAVMVVHKLLAHCPHIYVVVDGVDECNEEMSFLQTLDALISLRTYGLVKWLITSRDHAAIRGCMERAKAAEIQPNNDAVLQDVKAYFAANLSLTSQTRIYIEEESNFLYARFLCETIRGQGLTCEAEINEALERFPHDLTTYYARSLERISQRSKSEQELARRIFLILVGAVQSLTMDEVLDALSVRMGSRDYDKSRRPRPELIQDVCGHLITTEEQAPDGRNPILKFYHKSVRDFFLEDPEELQIPPHLRKYFTTLRESQRELGLSCLTYLNYDRYKKSLQVTKLLSENPIEHALLRYAASFWFLHLRHTKPDADVCKAIRGLLEGKAMWTCLSVQSHIAPFLFGHYAGLQRNQGRYLMGVSGPATLSGSDAFGVPLPQWLPAHSKDLALLDRSFCSFVQEWREVLATLPESLDMCAPLQRFQPECHLTPLSKPKSVKVAYLADDVSMETGTIVAFYLTHQGSLWANIVCRNNDDQENQLQKFRIPLFSDQMTTKSTHNCLPTSLSDTLSFTILQPEQDDRTLETWSLDEQGTTLTRTRENGSSDFEVPSPLHPGTDLGRDSQWKLHFSTHALPPSHGSILHHLAWIPVGQDHSGADKKDQPHDDRSVSDQHSDSSEASEDSSDDSSDDDSNDDSDDDDSVGPKDTSDSESTARLNGGPKQGQIAKETIMIMTPDGMPHWSKAWTRIAGRWAQVRVAAHPSLPLVTLSHTPLKLEIMDLVKNEQRTLNLPEIADLDDYTVASCRELQFSPCGNYLYLLLVSFRSQSNITICNVKLSTFLFDSNDDTDGSILRSFHADSFTYQIWRQLETIPTPLALTIWDSESVTVALPPLTCNPRIVKIRLPRDDGKATADPVREAILTLASPICFPSSTPYREPQLVRRTGSKGDDYLHLALGPLKSTPGFDSENRSSPPVVLRWKVSSKDGWVSWNEEKHGSSVDFGTNRETLHRLRGSFVDENKSFAVPIRGGLDWGRRGFLSCS
ncbi:hypothetical protein B0I35DRAFT_440686 [Stachybotrys elegans]|uniref:NACHT domain-containing protein n=1 Tax=Stachybotrys elegans TaxID=80388 RepID=A0A8K0SKB4_9HYPO|nr:hypothetical protein B0I35DRAFT_440686 [Stachybotrys elegans]